MNLYEERPAIRPGAASVYFAGMPVVSALADIVCGCQAALRPTSETDGLTSALVRSFARFTMDKDLTRLRICANPHCHWVFYDESRNASRRFCADDCSSLIRVRRYRARRR